MGYYLYILYSGSLDRYYVGVSHDPETRLRYHNTFPKGWTRRGRPWTLVFQKEFESDTEAREWEKWIKTQKNRKLVEKITDGEFVWERR